MKNRIGVVQMNSTTSPEHNLAYAKSVLKEAAREGVDLLAFPEIFLYIGQDEQTKYRIAQTLDGDIIQRFCDDAVHYGLSILLGSLYEKSADNDGRLYNTSILINRQGDIAAVYRKIHLFDAPYLNHFESEGIRAGDKPVVVDHEIGKLGLTICYDLRFPELYKYLALQGAEIIFVPSAFFLQTGKKHWLPLLTARAIENQVYIVAPNQWGVHHDNRQSFGSSVIIDPWGNHLSLAPESPGLISAEIDLAFLREVRANMPLQSHGRPELYQ